MKALDILNYIYRELSKENARGVFITPKVVKEAIDVLESMRHSNYPTTTDASSKECYVSLVKRVTHIENTLEEIFRASAYNKDALNKNKVVWHYFKSNQNYRNSK